MSTYVADKYFKPRRCPACDRLFMVPDPSAWAYKRKPGCNILYFCKWSCVRKWDREHPGKTRDNEEPDEEE